MILASYSQVRKKTMGKRGRPKGVKIDEQLTIRLSSSEKEQLQNYANSQGITITQAIRRFIEQTETESHDRNSSQTEL